MKKKRIIAVVVVVIIIIIAIFAINKVKDEKSEYEIARNRSI